MAAHSSSPGCRRLRLLLIVLILALVTVMAACSQPQSETGPQTISVMAIKGPSGVGMAKLMEDKAGGDSYSFTLANGPEQVVAALLSAEADIAALPTNLAAKLYAKTEGDIVMLAASTYGSLYLLERGDSLNSPTDLAGRTVYATGQGANPQYILEHLLTANGLTVGEDVEVAYKSEHAELATLLLSGDVNIAMLPEPFVTTVLLKDDSLRVALDLNQLWREQGQGELALTAIAAQRDFVEAYPQTVAAFLADLEDSIDFALNDPAATGELCAKYEIIPDAAIAEAAIPNCGLCFVSGAELGGFMESYFSMLLSADPASIGGALPGEDFYYQE